MNHADPIIHSILARNKRVEAEKAWETSKTRRGVIAVMTYVAACILLWWMQSGPYAYQALVPTAGYLFSTLSLPWIRRWWMQKNYRNGDE